MSLSFDNNSKITGNVLAYYKGTIHNLKNMQTKNFQTRGEQSKVICFFLLSSSQVNADI